MRQLDTIPPERQELALRVLDTVSNVPWHRVVNAKGEISPRSAGDSHELQRMLLEAEGVELDLRGRIDLEKFGVKSRNAKHRPERP